MAILPQLVPVLISILGLLIGLTHMSHWSSGVVLAWITFCAITAVSLVVDYGTSKKGSLGMSVLLLLSTLCMNENMPTRFWLWFVAMSVAIPQVLVSIQSLTSSRHRIVVPLLAVASLTMINVVDATGAEGETVGMIALGFVCLWSIVSLVFMNSKFREPERAWWLMGYSQIMLLIAALLIFPTLRVIQPLADYIILSIILSATLSSVAFPSRLGVTPLLRIVYMMLCLFVSLRIKEVHWIGPWVLVFTLALPMVSRHSSRKSWPETSILEFGGLGSAAFFACIWTIAQTRSQVDTWYYLLITLCFVFLCARAWQEVDRSQFFVEKPETNERQERISTLLRWGIQVVIIIFVFIEMIAKDLGWIVI